MQTVIQYSSWVRNIDMNDGFKSAEFAHALDIKYIQ